MKVYAGLTRAFFFLVLANIESEESSRAVKETSSTSADFPAVLQNLTLEKSLEHMQNAEQDNCKESLPSGIEEHDDQLAARGALLRKILNPEVYKNYVRPQGLEGPGSAVKVNVSLLIRNVDNIDDVNMEYNLQMTFRQTWIDPRLTFAHLHPSIPSLQFFQFQFQFQIVLFNVLLPVRTIKLGSSQGRHLVYEM